MCLKKIKYFHKKYRKRIRNFYSSSIAGLFAGIAIGSLLSLLTNTTVKKWENPIGHILIVVTYIVFVFLILYILYFFGKFCMQHFLSKNKEDLIGFHINYFTSVYVAVFSALLIILYDNISVCIFVALIFFIIYFLSKS